MSSARPAVYLRSPRMCPPTAHLYYTHFFHLLIPITLPLINVPVLTRMNIIFSQNPCCGVLTGRRLLQDKLWYFMSFCFIPTTQTAAQTSCVWGDDQEHPCNSPVCCCVPLLPKHLCLWKGAFDVLFLDVQFLPQECSGRKEALMRGAAFESGWNKNILRYYL